MSAAVHKADHAVTLLVPHYQWDRVTSHAVTFAPGTEHPGLSLAHLAGLCTQVRADCDGEEAWRSAHADGADAQRCGRRALEARGIVATRAAVAGGAKRGLGAQPSDPERALAAAKGARGPA